MPSSYIPKENGNASRREKWKLVNPDNTDGAIGRHMGVTPHAVRDWRERCGHPPFTRNGCHKFRQYVPYTEYQLKKKGLIPDAST